MNTRRTALARLSSLALFPIAASASQPSSTPPARARQLDLQGHRGARGLMPENTLEGFAHTLSLGVTTLELDIAITRDRVPVISHDPRLNPDITRGPDGKFLESPGPAIADLDFAQLAAYDVGRIKPDTRYARQFADQRPVDGARIPRFADLVALVRRMGKEQVRFAIETKVDPTRPGDTLPVEDFTRIVIEAIRGQGIAARSSVLSFDWRTLRQVAKEAPELATVHLSIEQPSFHTLRPGSPWTAGLDPAAYPSVPRLIKAAGGQTWSCFHGNLDAPRIKEAHELGLKVLAWTVNDAPRMEALIDLGVDGIVTDRPDRLRSVMTARGIALP